MTLIAAAVTGAFLLVRGKPDVRKTAGTGALLGLAVAFKYNAAIYGPGACCRAVGVPAAAPVVAYALYIVFGAAVRLAFLYDVRPNVRMAAGAAALLTIAIYVTWPRVPRALSSSSWSPRAGLVLAAVLAAGQVMQYVQWATGRTYKNYGASRALADALPPGTLVHGKLANGLSLEHRITPVFVGRGFGNYEDRGRRDDVRYILAYIVPSVGYESQKTNPVIQDVLDAHPSHTIIMTFDVAETATGHDRAALIDKFGRWLKISPLTQDALISNMEYVLAKAGVTS